MSLERPDLLANGGLSDPRFASYSGKTATFDQSHKQAHRIHPIHVPSPSIPNWN
jgi:hypothetical protein